MLGFYFMKQKEFIQQVIQKIKHDKNVIGLAVGGSFITGEMDAFSDLDLILVTVEPVAPDNKRMEEYARSFGAYLSGFTGEHVGERRVLICLYDNPLQHVDIKFLTIKEFEQRIENPTVVFDRDHQLQSVITSTKPEWPSLDYQWIEDRFWTWVHYAALKLGRGENFEALDFLSFVRVGVIAPLLQMKNKQFPRGLRKVEFNFPQEDLEALQRTVPVYDTNSLFFALDNTIHLYQALRHRIFPSTIDLKTKTETRSMEYLNEVKKARLK